MKNKGKLIAEIMAVCCVLSTPTFFNMHDMVTAAEVTFQDDKGIKLGENIAGSIEYEVPMIQCNIGLCKFVINCDPSKFSSKITDSDQKEQIEKEVVNKVLAMLNLEDTKKNKLDTLDQIATEKEIGNPGNLFEANQFIKFKVKAQKENENNYNDLTFNKNEETKNWLQQMISECDKFSVCRMTGYSPTIEYQKLNHQIILKIYINLPERDILFYGTRYESFKFCVEVTGNVLNPIESNNGDN